MATTDQRTGFRLPWAPDSRSAADPETGDPADGGETAEVPPHDGTAGSAATTDSATTAGDRDPSIPDGERPKAAPEPGHRSQNRFLVDLTRAMQTAAEAARTETLTQLRADAKACVEDLHGRSAGQASELRRRADDDVATIRDWSKAEIARIREQTEQRIAARKAELEHQLEVHAGMIEREIDRIHAQVGGFESDMERFFDRLRAEEDPGRIAALAARLPEPPPFVTSAVDLDTIVDGRPESDAAAAVLPVTDDGAETGPAIEPEPAIHPEPTAVAVAVDPDLAADLAAAEAEAAAAASDLDDAADPTETDPISARLASLIPERPVARTAPSTSSPIAHQTVASRPPVLSQVVVVGLISVSSIAGFKRHLARLDGVVSVGVASGPDGDFVFTVSHDPALSLADAVPTLPGFHARITSVGEGVLAVTARDPDTAS